MISVLVSKNAKRPKKKKEYIGLKTITQKAERKAEKKLFCIIPTKIKSSPTKLAVIGKLTFANINKNRVVVYIGIGLAKPE